ncbi:PDZ domain-containing protein [Variovorax sp. KK3]|uniref:PDZ domain-containing protein n=1 Tax=Variovorax sp. KK3 TaxID=1855728 RepID=UPI003565C895
MPCRMPCASERCCPAARPSRQALRVGDVLLMLDGIAVGGADDLLRLLDAGRIGRPLQLSLMREGRLLARTVTPQERVQPARNT